MLNKNCIQYEYCVVHVPNSWLFLLLKGSGRFLFFLALGLSYSNQFMMNRKDRLLIPPMKDEKGFHAFIAIGSFQLYFRRFYVKES